LHSQELKIPKDQPGRAKRHRNSCYFCWFFCSFDSSTSTKELQKIMQARDTEESARLASTGESIMNVLFGFFSNN